MAEESEVTSETDHFVGDCSDFVIKKNKKRKRQPVSDFDTGCLMEKEKNMNLEEKSKKVIWIWKKQNAAWRKSSRKTSG